MVAAEIMSGISGLKAAFDIAKGLKDIDDATRRNAAVIELQEKILTAQQTQSALVERISELEKEVAGFEEWNTEKEKYELKSVHTDTFAYASKSGAGSPIPPHFICANCYERRKKSILQRVDMAHLACPDCKTRIRFDSDEERSFRRDWSPRG